MKVNVKEYSNGLPCAHCMWIHHDYRKNRGGVPIMSRNLITANDYTSVFKSGFQYSLSFVLNRHESNPDDIHTFIGSVMDYIMILKQFYNIPGDVRYNILLNYGYKPELGSREHLHLFVTFTNNKGRTLFDVMTGTEGGYINREFRKRVADKLYATDTIKKLTYDDLMYRGIQSVFERDSRKKWNNRQSIYILLRIKIDNEEYSEFTQGQYSYPKIKRRGNRDRRNSHSRQ
jgi:hypothetical protein